MNRVVIKGVGVLSGLGSSENQLLANFVNYANDIQEQLELENILDAKKIRRMNRVAKMLTCTVKKCLDSRYLEDEFILENTGIIVNVVYGPVNTVLDFAKVVCQRRPDLASPTDFANTVNNAVVGHAAIYFGLKGPSTLLMGGNSVNYTMQLLRKNAAKDILTCGVEEYCEPVFNYGREKYKRKIFAEGAAALLLSNQGESAYGYLLGGAEAGLGYSPLFTESMDETDTFLRLYRKVLLTSNTKIDEIDSVFLATDSCSGLRASEENAINEIFPPSVDRIYFKDMFGETLGASMTLSIALAAIAIRNGKYKKVMVSGLEMSGTLEAFIVSRD